MTFAVVAEGSEYLSYEWYKDDVPINDPSVKTRSSIFTIPSFLPAEHKGSYKCVISSDYDGSVDIAVSKPAELKGNGNFMGHDIQMDQFTSAAYELAYPCK